MNSMCKGSIKLFYILTYTTTQENADYGPGSIQGRHFKPKPHEACVRGELQLQVTLEVHSLNICRIQIFSNLRKLVLLPLK
jgi:hypothetical protein